MAIYKHDKDDGYVAFIKETCLMARRDIIEAVDDHIDDPTERTHLIDNILGYLIATWIAARADDEERESYLQQFTEYLKASIDDLVKAKKEQEHGVPH